MAPTKRKGIATRAGNFLCFRQALRRDKTSFFVKPARVSVASMRDMPPTSPSRATWRKPTVLRNSLTTTGHPSDDGGRTRLWNHVCCGRSTHWRVDWRFFFYAWTKTASLSSSCWLPHTIFESGATYAGFRLLNGGHLLPYFCTIFRVVYGMLVLVCWIGGMFFFFSGDSSLSKLKPEWWK